MSSTAKQSVLVYVCARACVQRVCVCTCVRVHVRTVFMYVCVLVRSVCVRAREVCVRVYVCAQSVCVCVCVCVCVYVVCVCVYVRLTRTHLPSLIHLTLLCVIKKTNKCFPRRLGHADGFAMFM